MLYRFEYHRAHSVEDALLQLSEHPNSEPLAGCTNTLVDARARRRMPQVVVDINSLQDLRYARRENGVVRLGARTTLTDCLRLPFFEAQAPVLKNMAAEFAGELIRNRATLAGNIAYASPAADVVPPLLALDAQVTLISTRRGVRIMPLTDFITGPRKTILSQDELISEISFPVPDGEVRSGYFKFALRRAMAISLVSGAVVLVMNDGRIRQARIALGAVAPKPYRVTGAEKLLEGQAPVMDLVREAARMAADSTDPIDDIRASANYRREMTQVMMRRIIEKALSWR